MRVPAQEFSHIDYEGGIPRSEVVEMAREAFNEMDHIYLRGISWLIERKLRRIPLSVSETILRPEAPYSNIQRVSTGSRGILYRVLRQAAEVRGVEWLPERKPSWIKDK